VDKTAYQQGSTAAGEVCEIEEVGPVSVGTVRSLASDAFLEYLLVEDGAVVATHIGGRTVAARVRRLLRKRDPVCVIPGCGRSRHLEIHHIVPYALGGATDPANLVRLCSHHHDQITCHGAKLTGSFPDLSWEPRGDPAVGRAP
jgi:hypothetical protein